MKLYVLSDLHCEFQTFTPKIENDPDVVVLAGDIDHGTKGIKWARKVFPTLPVVYVAGNHEYYGESIPRLTDKLRMTARELDVAFLENDVTKIGEVRFAGCTLWTDLALHGSEPWREHEISQRMIDYRQIRVDPRYRRLRPQDTALFHSRSRRWLLELDDDSDPTVIVTHHAPSNRSVNPAYANDVVSAAYASHLENDVLGLNATMWIHGHTHHNVDYTIGTTRVLANQRGYEPDELAIDFDSSLVVSI